LCAAHRAASRCPVILAAGSNWCRRQARRPEGRYADRHPECKSAHARCEADRRGVLRGWRPKHTHRRPALVSRRQPVVPTGSSGMSSRRSSGQTLPSRRRTGTSSRSPDHSGLGQCRWDRDARIRPSRARSDQARPRTSR